jgi:hypothetical protein
MNDIATLFQNLLLTPFPGQPPGDEVGGILLDESTSSESCKDCGYKCNPYVFSSVETYLKYTEAVNLNCSQCCDNIISTGDTFQKYHEATGGDTPDPTDSIFIKVNSILFGTGGTSVVLQKQPTLHNGKPWYCFDSPACQNVVYWSTSAPHANKWVQSLNGLNGTNIVSVLNSNSYYPLTYSNLNSDMFWTMITASSITVEYTSLDQNGKIYVEYEYDPNTCVDIEFEQCYNLLETKLGANSICIVGDPGPPPFTGILQKGIVEHGNHFSNSGKSAICEILNILQDRNPNMTNQEICDMFLSILDDGIVVYRHIQTCQTLIATVEEFLKYAEANDICNI